MAKVTGRLGRIIINRRDAKVNKLKAFIKKAWDFLKKVWKVIDIGFVFASMIIGIVVIIVLSFLTKRKNKNPLDSNYVKKMKKILEEKTKNEETINNSGYDDYNDNGTLKRRKRGSRRKAK